MHSQREGIMDGTGSHAHHGSDQGPAYPWKLGFGLDGGSNSNGDTIANGTTLPQKGSALRWLRNVLWPRATEPSKPLRSTAYLDGLRGFAAFLVYIHHHELWVHASFVNNESAIFESSWGWGGHFRFATLPFIRQFFTGGHLAVAIFYVISGYVLSAKPLALIQAGDHVKLGDSLASSFFRRWFRLYLPLFGTTLLYVTSWHVFGYWNGACEAKATLGEELWNWYVELKNLSFLFNQGAIWPSFNTHLWSIPLEMRGSVVIFIACLALSRATTRARLLCQLALIYYFIYIVDAYYCALFIAGMLQCDLDLLAAARGTRADNGGGYFPRFLRRLEPYKTFIFYHLFVIGLWLSGVPAWSSKVEDLRENPGWRWLSYLKPQAVLDFKWFFLFFAANMLVSSIPRIPWLKRFFESRFCQFLGRVSYALYLVHGPILASLGDRIYHAVGFIRQVGDYQKELAPWLNIFPLSKAGPMGLEIAILVPQIILLPFTLWVADVVTRTMDEPAVRFAAWIYRRVLGAAPPKQEQEEEGVALRRLA
ncbi:acyltransferase family-domain-containing protein [Podospora appendiculata]|uniref:Acyltransferase family-domain-containing protein n=1 Tax=Podospora appendiculata TaxID=314037 RepID=A0AAE0X8A6_9PEZI|nr:acyltransferase family-domain-containing protein [Podospora appendiculata]